MITRAYDGYIATYNTVVKLMELFIVVTLVIYLNGRIAVVLDIKQTFNIYLLVSI